MDAEYYRDLKENPPKKGRTPARVYNPSGLWDLIWQFGGKTETILRGKKYPQCVSTRDSIKRSPNLKNGVLSIIPTKK